MLLRIVSSFISLASPLKFWFGDNNSAHKKHSSLVLYDVKTSSSATTEKRNQNDASFSTYVSPFNELNDEKSPPKRKFVT